MPADSSRETTMTNEVGVQSLEGRADAAIRRLLTLEVIEAKGLPVAASKWLRGTTKAELEADADELLAIRKSIRAKKAKTRPEADDDDDDDDERRAHRVAGPLKRGRQSAFKSAPKDPLLEALEKARVIPKSGWF